MDLCIINNASRLDHPWAVQLAKVEAMHRRKPKRQGDARQPEPGFRPGTMRRGHQLQVKEPLLEMHHVEPTAITRIF
jgi:hypothetical protein